MRVVRHYGTVLTAEWSARYLAEVPRDCDLFLDTHLYNGHTVVAEVLSLGVPVVGIRTCASSLPACAYRASSLGR